MNEGSKFRRLLFLLWYFARIGAFTFGGGWSIIAQMQRDFVEERHWMTEEDIVDMTSIGRSLPGVMIGNVSFMFGYRMAGVAGGVAAVFGLNAAPFVVLMILTNIYEGLRDKIDFRFRTSVTDIEQCDGPSYLLHTTDGDEFLSRYLIAAPGRSGAEWFAGQCRKLGLPMTNNQIDIGVRVELPALVFEHITDVVYESKLIYRTKQYGDQVRTFCMNRTATASTSPPCRTCSPAACSCSASATSRAASARTSTA